MEFTQDKTFKTKVNKLKTKPRQEKKKTTKFHKHTKTSPQNKGALQSRPNRLVQFFSTFFCQVDGEGSDAGVAKKPTLRADILDAYLSDCANQQNKMKKCTTSKQRKTKRVEKNRNPNKGPAGCKLFNFGKWFSEKPDQKVEKHETETIWKRLSKGEQDLKKRTEKADTQRRALEEKRRNKDDGRIGKSDYKENGAKKKVKDNVKNGRSVDRRSVAKYRVVKGDGVHELILQKDTHGNIGKMKRQCRKVDSELKPKSSRVKKNQVDVGDREQRVRRQPKSDHDDVEGRGWRDGADEKARGRRRRGHVAETREEDCDDECRRRRERADEEERGRRRRGHDVEVTEKIHDSRDDRGLRERRHRVEEGELGRRRRRQEAEVTEDIYDNWDGRGLRERRHRVEEGELGRRQRELEADKSYRFQLSYWKDVEKNERQLEKEQRQRKNEPNMSALRSKYTHARGLERLIAEQATTGLERERVGLATERERHDICGRRRWRSESVLGFVQSS